MALNVLAYNMKRVMARRALGPGQAERTEDSLPAAGVDRGAAGHRGAYRRRREGRRDAGGAGHGRDDQCGRRQERQLGAGVESVVRRPQAGAHSGGQRRLRSETFKACIAAPLPTWIASCAAPNRATCRSSFRPNTPSSSNAEPLRRTSSIAALLNIGDIVAARATGTSAPGRQPNQSRRPAVDGFGNRSRTCHRTNVRTSQTARLRLPTFVSARATSARYTRSCRQR
jgi:hypothetical protein